MSNYGRTFIPIDWEKVDNALITGSPGTTIANALGIHPDTLYYRCVEEKGMSWTDYSAKMKSKGDEAIYNAKYDEAVNKRNTTMLIWLSKSRLGQKETVTHESKVTLVDAVRELDPTISGAKVSDDTKVETGTPILDQGCSGTESPV